MQPRHPVSTQRRMQLCTSSTHAHYRVQAVQWNSRSCIVFSQAAWLSDAKHSKALLQSHSCRPGSRHTICLLNSLVCHHSKSVMTNSMSPTVCVHVHTAGKRPAHSTAFVDDVHLEACGHDLKYLVH